ANAAFSHTMPRSHTASTRTGHGGTALRANSAARSRPAGKRARDRGQRGVPMRAVARSERALHGFCNAAICCELAILRLSDISRDVSVSFFIVRIAALCVAFSRDGRSDACHDLCCTVIRDYAEE